MSKARMERPADDLRVLPITDLDLKETRFQHRGSADNPELAKSIREIGQLAPVEVMGDRPPYVLLSGWSRVMALRKLGRRTVKAIVRPPLPAEEAHRHAMHENLKRKALSDFEIVKAARTMQEQGLALAAIAKAFGRDTRQVQNYLRISKAPPAVLDALENGKISATLALAVLHSAGKAPVEDVLREVMEKGLSVSETRKLVQERAGRLQGAPTQPSRYHLKKFKGGSFNLSVRFKPRRWDPATIRALVRDLDELLAVLKERISSTHRSRA